MNRKDPLLERQKLLQMLAKKTGRDAARVEQELAKGDVSGVLGGLDDASKAEAEKVLADPELIRQILESPQMKAFLRQITGG